MKSRFRGSCQKCGAVQKLPKGVLAKHGYEVARWGFFNGVCDGSGYKPFEESCVRVEEYVQRAGRYAEELKATIAKLREPATEPKAWLHQYVPATFERRRSAYRWIQVTLIEQQHQFRDGSGGYSLFGYMKDDGKFEEVRTGYGEERTLLNAATILNQRRAESLTGTLKEVERYIAWQQERVANWKPAPLIPVEPEAAKTEKQ